MTTPIHAHIEARLDELEAAARAATAGPWFVEPVGDFGEKRAMIADVLSGLYGKDALNFGEDFATAEHVSLHNPAAVLTRVAADREILALHEPCEVDDYGVPECGTCNAWPCDTILALAEGLGWSE